MQDEPLAHEVGILFSRWVRSEVGTSNVPVEMLGPIARDWFERFG